MTISTTITHEGGVGVFPPSASGVVAVLGTSSTGTLNTPTEITRSNVHKVRDTFGYGDLVKKAQELFRGPIQKLNITRVSSDNAGVIGAVVKTVDATTTGTMTVTGATPNATYDIHVKVVKAGDIGTATFRVSKDGGKSFGDTILSASTYAIPNTGLTLNLTGGAATAFIVDDKYEVHVDGPTANVATIQAAITELKTVFRSKGFRFESLYIAFPIAASVATTLKTDIDALRTTDLIFTKVYLEGETVHAPLECDGTNSKFSIVAPGTGNNAISSAQDITPASTVGVAQAAIATDLTTKINAIADVPGSADWVVTAQADGTFKLDSTATAGVTSITITTPATGESCVNQLFGTANDQDAVAGTWTGSTPRWEASSVLQTRLEADYMSFGHDSFVVIAGMVQSVLTNGETQFIHGAPYFIGRETSNVANRSAAIPEDGSYPGIVTLHPGDWDATIVASLRTAKFTTMARTLLGKILTEEDLVMKATGSNMKYSTWLKIENSILTEAIDIIDDFRNQETSPGNIEILETRLNSVMRSRISNSIISSGKFQIPDGQDFATATEIDVVGDWSPFGRFSNIKLTFSLILPNPLA